MIRFASFPGDLVEIYQAFEVINNSSRSCSSAGETVLKDTVTGDSRKIHGLYRSRAASVVAMVGFCFP